jgi:hypothetical protein
MRTKLIAIALAAAFPLGAYAQGTTKPDQQQRPGASSPTPAPQSGSGAGSSGMQPGTARLDTNRRRAHFARRSEGVVRAQLAFQ